jgi:hypothetical protein
VILLRTTDERRTGEEEKKEKERSIRPYKMNFAHT